MGPDFLAQELGWFSQNTIARRGRPVRELRARLDFEDDWDDDLDDKVREITGAYDVAGDLDDLEDDDDLLGDVESEDEDD